MRLCLLVSRRCDLRCGFCRVRFTGQDMSWPTARSAIERYLESLPAGAEPRVKFFGGEPLLNWAVVRSAVEAGRREWARRGVRYELATNGSFLDDGKRRFLSAHPEVEVTVSFPVPGGEPVPGAWYTMVLERATPPSAPVRLLARLLREGYRRFNVLPAYFLPWSRTQLEDLERALEGLRLSFEGLWSAGVGARIRNLEVWSPVPLFNAALTADVDGSFYASNIVQARGLEAARPALYLGRVDGPAPSLEALRSRERLLEPLLRRWAGERAWDSTRRADAALTRWVERLRARRPEEAGAGPRRGAS